MSKAIKAREKLLDGAVDIIKHKIALATGQESELDYAMLDQKTQDQVWDAILPMIQKADDTTEGFDTEGSAAKAALSILEKLGKGEVTPDEAKKMMEVVSQVYDVTELQNLIAQVVDMESCKQ